MRRERLGSSGLKATDIAPASDRAGTGEPARREDYDHVSSKNKRRRGDGLYRQYINHFLHRLACLLKRVMSIARSIKKFADHMFLVQPHIADVMGTTNRR